MEKRMRGALKIFSFKSKRLEWPSTQLRKGEGRHLCDLEEWNLWVGPQSSELCRGKYKGSSNIVRGSRRSLDDNQTNMFPTDTQF